MTKLTCQCNCNLTLETEDKAYLQAIPILST